MALTVSGNSVRPIRLAGLLALVILAQAWQQARAQNVAPLEPTFVFHTGGATFNYVNGFGWKGIVGDTIDAGYGWTNKFPELFNRANVRVVCAGQCPDAFNRYAQSPQDKVVWKQGPPTVGGRIEIKCGEYHHCIVYQDDKPVHPNADYRGDWEKISYVELAPAAKP
jgi:hypothetical protein